MEAAVLLAWIASAGCLAGGLWALSRRANRPVPARLAGLYCLLAMISAALPIMQRAGWLRSLRVDFTARLPVYAVFLAAVVLLLLTLALVGRRATDWRVLLPAALLLSAALAIDAGVLSPPTLFFAGGRTLSPANLGVTLLMVGWAVCMGFSVGLTAWTLRHSSRYDIPLSYWAVVLLLAVAGDGLLLAGQAAIGGLVRLAAALPAVFVATSVRLPAIDHAVRRVFGSLVLAAASIGIYSAALTALQVIFPQWKNANPLAVSLAASVVLVLVFGGVVQRIYRWERRAIGRGSRQDATGVLRQYSQSITGTLDLGRLAALAVGTASEFLEVKRGYLFLVNQEQEPDEKTRFTLHGVTGMGPRNPEDGTLGQTSPLAVYFRESRRPLTQADIGRETAYATMPVEERQWLETLGAEVYVPIFAKGEWIGLLTLGPKGAGTDYTPRDLALLSTLADQTAVALENTRLVEGLMRLNNEFRRAYTALDQANQHLERLDKTKSDFISIASHELRTPLTLINGASQMLLDDPELPDNPYHQQLLQKIKAGGDRLYEIVETMLDMAKIDARTLELEPQPVSMPALLESLCAELGKDAEERKQTLTVEIPRELPAVIADVVALRKVFQHLLTNAIKYTPDGGQVTVTGQRVEPNTTDLLHGGIEVVVSDTGIGIDPRFHELIFRKFYQTGELALHSTGKTKFKGGGPGLGLAISRGIVEAHHGRIWVESAGYDEEHCPGSQFHVVLPLRPGDRPAAPSASLRQ